MLAGGGFLQVHVSAYLSFQVSAAVINRVRASKCRFNSELISILVEVLSYKYVAAVICLSFILIIK